MKPAHLHTVLCVATLLISATPAWSQTSWGRNVWGIPETLTSSVHGMAIGDFNGDRIRDAAVIHGTKLTLLSAPDDQQSWDHLSETISVNDLATLPRGGTDGLDAIVTIGADGVRVWTLDTNDDFFSTLIAAGPLMGGAHIRAGNLEPGESAQIVAVDANGTTLYRFERSGSSWSQAQFAVTTTPVVDLEILDWAADSSSSTTADGSDVAVATAGTLTVYAGTTAAALTTLTGLTQISGSHVLLDMQPVRHRSTTREQLAIVAQSTGGWRWLVVVGAERLTAEVAVPLGALDVAGLASGDLGEDGSSHDSELFVSHRTSQDQAYFINQSTTSGSSQSYSIAEGCVGVEPIGPSGVSFATNDSTPACADFDNDGDLDVLFVCRPCTSQNPISTVVVYRSFATGEIARRATVVDLPEIDDALIYTYNTTPDVSVLFDLARPEAPTTGATHVEIVAWLRNVGSSFVEPEPIGQFAYEFPASWSTTSPEPLHCDLFIDGTMYDPLSDDVLFLEARVFSYASNGLDYDVIGPTAVLRLSVTDEEFAASLLSLTEAYGPNVATPNVPAPDLNPEDIQVPGESQPPDDPSYDPDTGVGDFDPSFTPDDVGKGIEYAVASGGGTPPPKRSAINTGGFTTIVHLDPFAPHIQSKPKRHPTPIAN